jgi:hypothetical protein
LAALACAVLAACATNTAAFEPQNRPRNAHQARIYVMWAKSWTCRYCEYDVLINDKRVGRLGQDSYLSVDRPPGSYKLTVKAKLLDLAPTQHEFQAVAGRTYYFVINVKPQEYPIMGGGFFTMPGTAVGRPVKQRNFLSGTYLAVLDNAAGAAEIARRKPPH